MRVLAAQVRLDADVVARAGGVRESDKQLGAPGLELLIDKIKTTRSNDEFLAEVAKSPGM